jgi:hypothetical protein
MNHAEFTESQLRRFFVTLFTKRAQRHLKTLADAYGWSPEFLAAQEARFIQPAKLAPHWAERR